MKKKKATIDNFYMATKYEKVKQPISNIIQGRASIYLNVKGFKSMNHIVSLKAEQESK